MHRILAAIPMMVCLALLLSDTVYGQDDKSRFDLDIGYRWKTGFRGSEDLYRSQLDYGEGPKLFSGNFLLSPSEESRGLFDFFELKLNSWGGRTLQHPAAQGHQGRSVRTPVRLPEHSLFQRHSFLLQPALRTG